MRTLLFLFTTCLLLSSCSKDPLSDQIIGKWNFVSIESNSCDDADDNISLTTVGDDGCFMIFGENVCNVFITFNTDGTASESITDTSGSVNYDFNYTVDDSNDSIEFCTISECDEVTIDGNRLTRIALDGDGCITTVIYEKM